MLRNCILLSITLLLVASRLEASLRPYTEVRSPHFVVFTDGSAGDGRRVAREFEQMRGVFAYVLPNLRLETGAPLIIFAVQNEQSMKSLNPSPWKGKHLPKLAGYFSHHWEKTFAVIRLDQDIPGAYQVVYHEYVHSLLHANFRWLPNWLDEGLADYYGASVFQEKKTYVGAPSLRMGRMRNRLLIPIEKLIVQNPYAAYRGDSERIDTFYGESEALVHYLLLGEGMERGRKLNDFFAKIQRGQDQAKAFKETFGEFSAVQRQFELYVRAFAFATFVVNDPPQIDQKDFAVRTTTAAETEAALATFRIWEHDLPEAGEMADAALRDGPNLAAAHAAKAFLLFASGKDSEAAAEFGNTLALNDKDYLALYYQTMLSAEAHSDKESDQVTFRDNLNRVVALNRQFAPAYVELAKLSLRRGELDNATANARKAEGSEPTRAGYHLFLARILQRKGSLADAAKLAAYVAERWTGPDHDEAQDLLNSFPAAERPAVSPLEDTMADTQRDLQKLEGKIRAISCNESGIPQALTLDRDGSSTVYVIAGGFPAGFSDTLWFGADHFSLCHHVEGLKALAFSKAEIQKDAAVQLAKLEIREDLPTRPAPKTATVAAPEKQGP